MRKLMLNTYMWVAVAFYVVALADVANDGSIWIVWFALGMVFTIIAFRKQKAEPHPEAAEQEETP